jgi:membrane protease YdiL (CAAX protease family)
MTSDAAPVSGWRLLLALVLWALLATAALGLTLLGFGLAAHDWEVAHQAAVGAILVALAYLTLLVALLLAYGSPRRLAFRFTSGLDMAGALATWMFALIVAGFVASALAPLMGRPQSNTVTLLRQSYDPIFVVLIVPTVCLLAPFCEELLFRGALYGWLSRLLPVPLAIVLVAAIFAGAHLLPPLIPVLFVLGLAITWVRARTGSTLNTFLMHATQNTFAVVLTYLYIANG